MQIPHRALRAFFTAVWPLLEIDADARCLNTSALHFDVSVVDLLLPLYRGATVHLGPLFPMPAVLTDIIERERITHMAAVGSTLALVAQHTDGFRGRDVTALRRLMTGAEVLDPRAVQAWLAAAPDLVVVNGYGPTEATCLVAAHPIGEREPDRTEPYPIGRPLAGVRIGFLGDGGGLDDHGPGEILVAGEQVMTGYLNRPEENAFQDVDGVRFYRTGDRGHRRDDGVLLFHGRHDDEVKVRGYRVNLNEVRRAVETHPHVGRAFVALVTDHRGAAVLSCAVAEKAAPAVPAGDGVELAPAARAGSIRTHLAARLPGYMVPAAFHELKAVPTLPSGKPDTATILKSLRAAHTITHAPTGAPADTVAHAASDTASHAATGAVAPTVGDTAADTACHSAAGVAADAIAGTAADVVALAAGDTAADMAADVAPARR
ncbi:hypothetical protein GCM10029964_082610 [Kibdelosporangium lantanae]